MWDLFSFWGGSQFFAHGLAYGDDYTLALGYGGESDNPLNIYASDLSQIKSSSFAENSSTYFGVCRTGNSFGNNSSFAQQWVNLTGGTALAPVRSSSPPAKDNGRTYYGNIFPDERSTLHKGFSRLPLIGNRTNKARREIARASVGYSEFGCSNYPTITDGGSWQTFKPRVYGTVR